MEHTIGYPPFGPAHSYRLAAVTGTPTISRHNDSDGRIDRYTLADTVKTLSYDRPERDGICNPVPNVSPMPLRVRLWHSPYRSLGMRETSATRRSAPPTATASPTISRHNDNDVRIDRYTLSQLGYAPHTFSVLWN